MRFAVLSCTSFFVRHDLLYTASLCSLAVIVIICSVLSGYKCGFVNKRSLGYLILSVPSLSVYSSTYMMCCALRVLLFCFDLRTFCASG